MKNRFCYLLAGTALLITGAATMAQPAETAYTSWESRDTIAQKGYTLVVINKEKELDSAVKQRMIDAFFTVYPKQAAIYNKTTLKTVTFVFDPAYGGVAECANGIITFSPTWLKKMPGDIDVVTHESMHIVQNYPDGAGPGWLTEGIADYVRYTLGVDNAGAPWSLPAFSASQHYENAYRVTARFLVWVENKKAKGAVKKLDDAMRSKTYTDGIWKKLAGKNVDELWKEYSANPAL